MQTLRPMQRRSPASLARAFARARGGGVALWFGLAFPAVAFASLVAVDFSRASTADQSLQEILDASALIAARSTAITSDQVDAVGDAALAALLSGDNTIGGLTPNAQGRIANATFTVSGTNIDAAVTATVTPIVAGAFLGGPMTIRANSSVVRSINKLEIALVLDTTGSMQGTRITNLIAAAKNFITTMEEAAARSTEPNPVKISIVPFSTTVRVQDPLSMASYNTSTFSMTGLPTWLDGRARSTPWDKDIFTLSSSTATRVDRFARLKAIGRSWGGCVEARAAPYDIRETAPTSSNVSTLFTPWFWPDEPDTHSDYLNDYLNDGASSSATWQARQGASAKYSTTTFKVSGTFIPSSGYGSGWVYGPNAACDMQKIMRLSTNFTALRTHVDGLVPSGETNIPLGLMWGWHTLTPNAPFADGVAYGTPQTTKIIVLMTDGDNTMNIPGSNNANRSFYHGYGYAWQGRLVGLNASDSGGTRTDKLDARMVSPTGGEDLCGNIKARNILIYAVGVGVSADSANLLKACATTTDNYYSVNSTASNLDAAFDAIAGSIQNLRISH